MNKITVGIVTFRQRYDLVKALLQQLTDHLPPNVDIILAVNSNIGDDGMESVYKDSMKKLALEYENVYPIFCPEFKSLSKLWNTIAIFSKTEYVLMLGDDVDFSNPEAFDIVNRCIEDYSASFFTINNGFSHFVINKDILHTLGYFDERLLGFGEEDGDMVHRYTEVFGSQLPSVHIPGVINKAAYTLKDDTIETHIDNKPKFNRELANLKFEYDPDGTNKGMDVRPLKRVIENYQQYPYERFVKLNKHNLLKHNNINIEY
jgi:hypothetical protein